MGRRVKLGQAIDSDREGDSGRRRCRFVLRSLEQSTYRKRCRVQTSKSCSSRCTVRILRRREHEISGSSATVPRRRRASESRTKTGALTCSPPQLLSLKDRLS